jgi:hypothetical protein
VIVAVLGHGDRRRGVVVLVGEVDLLLALFGDRHRGDDGVELAGKQGRNDAVPVLGDEFALDLHLGAQGVGDVDVEADEAAVGLEVVEGRVGALGADDDLLHAAVAGRLGRSAHGKGKGCSGDCKGKASGN